MGPNRDRPLDLQLDTHLHSDTLPTALRGPAQLKTEVRNEKLSREYSPVENQNDLELDFKVFFFVDSCG